MKVYLLVQFIILFSINALSQQIPADKLFSFFGKNVSVAENYLQLSAYKFHKKESSKFSPETYIFWRTGTDDEERHLQLIVDTITSKVTGVTYNYYTKAEYGTLLNTIPTLGFTDFGSLWYRDKEVNKEFAKGNIHALISATEYYTDKFSYALTFCYCSYVRN